MNDAACDTFLQSRTPYPVGSVVVKEKLGPADVEGVGGMLKRPRGYDPAGGDWEYFYFERASEVESGKVGTCVECHRQAASRDYVFANWADRAPASPLRAQ
jgi:hypothetical protein